MNPASSPFGGATLWLLAFVAIAAVISWETDWGRRMTREPPKMPLPVPQPVEIALLPEYRLEGGTAARRETVERPAFIPTRRPSPAPAQEAAKPRMQKGQFTLTGTAVVDEKAIAFLRENAGGKARSVRAGESINGVTVVEIGRDRVKLALGDESEELVLKVAGGPRVTIQPQAQAPGQPTLPPGAQPPGTGRPVPGTPAGAPIAGQPAPIDSDQSILERRRAARAAQAAAEAARAAGQTPPPAQAAPLTPPQRQSATLPDPPANVDPAWAETYRRMQQRNR